MVFLGLPDVIDSDPSDAVRLPGKSFIIIIPVCDFSMQVKGGLKENTREV